MNEQHEHGHVGFGGEDPHEPSERFAGKQIPPTSFADDDGTTPPAVAAALDQWRRDGDPAPVVAALLESRLLVALVAVLDSEDQAGMEKDSHMAAAMLVRPDGRKALVAHTSAELLSQWRPEARPMPVPAVEVARAALGDGADAVLVDGQLPLFGAALWALAEGRPMLGLEADPAVRSAVEVAADEVLGAAGCPTEVHLLAGGDAMAPALTVLVRPELAAERDLVTAFAERLAGDPVLRLRAQGGLSIGIVGR
ncbi:MAG: SseB family protein [Candidatus Nanopelagicales bacterium]